jgi:hypothetical protein
MADRRTTTETDVTDLLAAEAAQVKREIANADPQTGLADLKRRMKTPKPAVGYLVENAGWAIPPKTRTSWILPLPQMYVGLKDAQAARDGFQAMAPNAPSKVILEATITFRIVEGGDRG